MKTCPLCKNKGWPEDSVIKSPIINIGGKINLSSGAIRRYICLNCRHAIETSETLLSHAEATDNQMHIAERITNQQLDLIKERLNVETQQVELFDIGELYGQSARFSG